MNKTNLHPVIVLTFANDQDKYLEMIRRERKNVFKVLQSYHDQGYIQVHKEESTAIEDIFELFNRYSDRIAIFHYGGHASGTHLQLEAVSGKAQMANATGLAQLLGQQNALQLVFLNGCATSAQVKLLFDCGVKLVIATSVPIEDVMATEFAEQFYSALVSHATIQEAFKRAKAFIATRYGTTREVREFRNLAWDDAKDKQSSELPWGLYINNNGEEALAWKLPEIMPKVATATERRRLEQKRAILQSEWDLRNEKTKRLRAAFAIETDTAVKFKTEQQLKAEENELSKLEEQITTIEKGLS